MDEITIKSQLPLEGVDGNAFVVMGVVVRGLRRAGADEAYIAKYRERAMSGDYDNLLAVSMQYTEDPFLDGDDDSDDEDYDDEDEE